ncbi:chaplin family protein, partial [Arthrobacter sp. CC3]|uniref:chaplin family protein n=1 Tax=Arthrobacter sp. CC3 TaxID=3029185 RepID=UPI003267AC73
GTNTSGSTTNGSDGLASGTQVIAPVTAPATVGTTSLGLLGDSTATGNTGTSTAPAGTNTSGSTNGSDGLASGNQVIAPVTAPITVGGASVGIAGDSSSAVVPPVVAPPAVNPPVVTPPVATPPLVFGPAIAPPAAAAEGPSPLELPGTNMAPAAASVTPLAASGRSNTGANLLANTGANLDLVTAALLLLAGGMIVMLALTRRRKA